MKRKDKVAEEKLFAQRAYRLFDSYRSAYMREWQRLENNERMYRGDHWYDVPVTDPNEPRPVTPIIQSTVESLSADLMDECPEAIITPEHGVDNRAARIVEAVIARNHDVSGYPVEYKKLVHDLLVGGYCVQEVGYDPSLNNGLGGAYIRSVDNRSILFDPLCDDMQEGRGVFKFSLRSRQWVEEHYPEKAALIGEDVYAYDQRPMDAGIVSPVFEPATSKGGGHHGGGQCHCSEREQSEPELCHSLQQGGGAGKTDTDFRGKGGIKYE